MRSRFLVHAALTICAATLLTVAVPNAQVPKPRPERAQSSNAAPSAGVDRAPTKRRGFLSGLFGRGGGAGAGTRQTALMEAYPGAFRIEGNSVVFPTGERIVWDDGRRKSPAELLQSADVEDMFAYPYPLARQGDRRPPRSEDPGRVRNDAFFKALYGASSGAVSADVRAVPWVPKLGGGTLNMTTRFGVDRQLSAASNELERLPQKFHKYLRPSAGAFMWRRIAGTNRMSVHSFGAALDINTHYANYWRWDKQPANQSIAYRNEIPMEIVEIFEKYCFIWGGRWYHYDTMHFEYRPELLPDCRRV
ncbi:MAG: M15 family metallopeptidase [Pseudomonadota bacterium]